MGAKAAGGVPDFDGDRIGSAALERLLENTGEAVFIVGNDGRFRWCNSVTLELLGIPRHEFIGKSFKTFLPRSALAGVMREFVVHARGKSVKPFRTEVVSPSGKVLKFEINAVPYVVHGTLRGVIAFGRDLTERWRMERALEQAEREYITMLESTGTAVMIIEKDMTVVRVNKTFTELTGYTREEFEGKKKWTELVANKDDLARMKRYHVQRRIDPNLAPKAYRFSLRDKNGGVKAILMNVDVVPGTKRSVASMVDITERARALDALERMRDQASASLKHETDALRSRVAELEREERAYESTLSASLGPRTAARKPGRKAKLGERVREMHETVDRSLRRQLNKIRHGLKRMGKKRKAGG